MGTDYKCGCRESGGNFYPCKKHKKMLYKDIAKTESKKSREEMYSYGDIDYKDLKQDKKLTKKLR